MPHQVTEFMIQRNSSPRLMAPAPDEVTLNTLFQTALRAPDHGMIRPWRYMVVQGVALKKLGDLFASSAIIDDPSLSTEQLEKYRNMPLRAPMVLIAIASVQQHPKAPEVEQVMSAAVGVGYLLLALQAEGYGGMWRTGPLAYSDSVRDGLGLKGNEKIVGFLYVGTPNGKGKTIPTHDVRDFVTSWG